MKFPLLSTALLFLAVALDIPGQAAGRLNDAGQIVPDVRVTVTTDGWDFLNTDRRLPGKSRYGN